MGEAEAYTANRSIGVKDLRARFDAPLFLQVAVLPRLPESPAPGQVKNGAEL